MSWPNLVNVQSGQNYLPSHINDLQTAATILHTTTQATSATVQALNYYDVGGGCDGTATANQNLLVFPFPTGRVAKLLQVGSGSVALALAPANATTTCTVWRRHAGTNTQIGTLTWAAGGTQGTYDFTLAGGDVTFVPGDILRITAPASPDATLADIALTVSLTPQQVPMPPSLASLLVCYLPHYTSVITSGAISEVSDLSGNALHATQGTSASRPTLTANLANSLAGATFDGSNDFLTLPTLPATGTAMTFYTVLRRAASGNFRTVWDFTSDGGNSDEIQWQETGAGADGMDFILRNTGASVSDDAVVTAVPHGTTFCTYTVVANGTAVAGYQNGASNFSKTYATAITNVTRPSGTIGIENDGVTGAMGMDLLAFLAYTTAHGSTVQANTEAWLRGLFAHY